MREKILDENSIKITTENQETLIGDLEDLIETIELFEDLNIEVNPTEDSLLLNGDNAINQIKEIIERIQSCEIDHIRIKTNEWGDTITIEVFSKNF